MTVRAAPADLASPQPRGMRRSKPARRTVLTVFGTRPEAIKLWPVIRALDARPEALRVINVSTAQHEELLRPLTKALDIRVRHDLSVMTHDQTPNQVCARILERLEPVLVQERPDLVIVQGDTTSALAGALTAFHASVRVAHVEAGLRTGNPASPFPEELNRRLISQLATYHFAPTSGNRDNLTAEGIDREAIFITGNPVIDAVREIASRPVPREIESVLGQTKGLRRVLLTAHRRENRGRLAASFRSLRKFVEERDDVAVLFPVHPSPAVREAATREFEGCGGIHLLPPLAYPSFMQLMRCCWLVVSDSGGVQEEAAFLGKPLLILRDDTERPEAVKCGSARLVGLRPEALLSRLEEVYSDPEWERACKGVESPFGDGSAGLQIAEILTDCISREAQHSPIP